MGDRVSIQFKKGKRVSPVLFSHWGGRDFLKQVKKYANELVKERGKTAVLQPLDRREPDTVIVDFIRYITKDMKRVESDLYLGATQHDGDNSDNGHWVFDLEKMKFDEEL